MVVSWRGVGNLSTGLCLSSMTRLLSRRQVNNVHHLSLSGVISRHPKQGCIVAMQGVWLESRYFGVS